MRETWYMLEDGRVVDPSEVTTREDGRLAHASGALVAMKGDVPRSRNVDPDEERAKAPPAPRDMSADEPKRGYKTRESKAR